MLRFSRYLFLILFCFTMLWAYRAKADIVVKSYINTETTSGSGPWTIYTVPAGCYLEVNLLTYTFVKSGTWNGNIVTKLGGVIIDSQSDGGATSPKFVAIVGTAPTVAGVKGTIDATKQTRLGPGAILIDLTTSTGSISSFYLYIHGVLFCNK